MERINLESLKFLINENKDKRVLITFHSIGDSDSVSSAFGISKAFSNASIATPDIVTANALRILKKVGFTGEKINSSFDEKAELVVLVDVNNFDDCGPFNYRLQEFKGPIIIIDHHFPKDIQKENVFVFNDESFNSAASIVYTLLEGLNVGIDELTANLLVTGIVSDSADLRNATPDTFIQIGKLLKTAKMQYQDVLEEILHISDPFSRAKTFYDVADSKVEVYGDLLFVRGMAHAHANLAADAAIKAGADIAIFYTETEKELSISARLRPPLDRKYGIHLGAMMKELAKSINGNGGGHPGAAGAYGPLTEDPEEFTRRLIDMILKKAKIS